MAADPAFLATPAGDCSAPRRSLGTRDRESLRSAIADLYGVIAVLDSAHQSDFAGRLHSLTLELRQRVSSAETEQ